ncbi:hypothetical protein Tco_1069926 [Tanacetum coccineum]|uniref:Uncharacterized protein n=1 Tax=Tanacetum coccineum TaxID=301880 RepID=A0ABQ5HK70_9ASTR
MKYSPHKPYSMTVNSMLPVIVSVIGRVNSKSDQIEVMLSLPIQGVNSPCAINQSTTGLIRSTSRELKDLPELGRCGTLRARRCRARAEQKLWFFLSKSQCSDNILKFSKHQMKHLGGKELSTYLGNNCLSS